MEYGDCREGGMDSVVGKEWFRSWECGEKVDPLPMFLICGAVDCFDVEKSS